MSFLVERPRGARAVFVLAHGAGAGMRHPFMQSMAAALAEERIATLRFEFPYMAEGRRRIDAFEVLERAIIDAVKRARRLKLPIFAGGKSMGGRITSMTAARGLLPGVRGLVFLGYPLHPAKKPATKRAEHLPEVPMPMLFVQGTRDALADLSLLRPIVKKLPTATLHVVDGADHSFKVARRAQADVIAELARVTAEFCSRA